MMLGSTVTLKELQQMLDEGHNLSEVIVHLKEKGTESLVKRLSQLLLETETYAKHKEVDVTFIVGDDVIRSRDNLAQTIEGLYESGKLEGATVGMNYGSDSEHYRHLSRADCDVLGNYLTKTLQESMLKPAGIVCQLRCSTERDDYCLNNFSMHTNFSLPEAPDDLVLLKKVVDFISYAKRWEGFAVQKISNRNMQGLSELDAIIENARVKLEL